jgi:hypothetical protein
MYDLIFICAGGCVPCEETLQACQRFLPHLDNIARTGSFSSEGVSAANSARGLSIFSREKVLLCIQYKKGNYLMNKRGGGDKYL